MDEPVLTGLDTLAPEYWMLLAEFLRRGEPGQVIWHCEAGGRVAMVETRTFARRTNGAGVSPPVVIDTIDRTA